LQLLSKRLLKASAAVSASSGSSTDLTPVYTAISGKANTVHKHALSSLTQSVATTNQVPQWNGSAWVPATVTTDQNIDGGRANSVPVLSLLVDGGGA
jgi:hypothetical protein